MIQVTNPPDQPSRDAHTGLMENNPFAPLFDVGDADQQGLDTSSLLVADPSVSSPSRENKNSNQDKSKSHKSKST